MNLNEKLCRACVAVWVAVSLIYLAAGPFAFTCSQEDTQAAPERKKPNDPR